MERTCNRCGIRFDATGMAPDAPCTDCQDVTGELDLNVWSTNYSRVAGAGKKIPQEVLDERRRQLMHYTVGQKLSVRETAKRVGASERMVSRWRAKLQIPVPEREILLRSVLWRKDPAPPRRGTNRPLTPEERRDIFDLVRNQGWSYSRVERERGIQRQTASRVVRSMEHAED